MARSVLRWIAALNSAGALLLADRANSQVKTVMKVSADTIKTLTDANDRHSGFVRNMLDFIKEGTSHLPIVAFLVAVLLAVNAVILWRLSSSPSKSHE